ncbi:acetate--CoA ligase family protein [Hyphomicrobium sp. CS1BSMeth3]|uniref:acetate--CoA ligase family protein n=1 Tax=Hyphomicrobium sp. CS1BSMeth3 TaxID=1892844 RepID=UPI0009310337|nr:acetate--CoA ligase family protein [Hyphomicrobium sp. CS1BSMeth3]
MARPFADCLLRPERVAIVGASGDVKKNNSRPQRYLRKHGFTGTIYPINPGYKELFGEPCYASLADCPEPPDHAYVMLGTNSVVEAIRDCGKAGVAAATIFAGGFAEGGEAGKARQAALIAAAREGGVRLIGPNSLGVINTHWPLTLSANAVLERERLPKGRTGLVSQSGSMIGALVSRGEARGIGFSTLVSIGNECDLTVGEIASMLVDDPDTDVILLFLETMRDPVGVAEMARKAHAAGKPVMAYVLGRSDLGQALAQSHTGAMVGETRALDAFLSDCGIMRLDHFESLIEAPLLLKGRKPAKGKRVAVTTTTGGAAALVVDHLGSRGIEVVPAAETLSEGLAAFKIDVAPGAPIADLTMAGTKPEVVDTVMSSFMADPRVDAVVVGVGSSAEYFPELAVAPLAKWASAEKPIVAFLLPNAQRSLELLAGAGIAGFRTPEACADALGAYLDWTPPRAKDAIALPAAARAALDGAKGAATLNEQRALELFSALGVPVPAIAQVSDAAGVDALKLNYPVVAKILSADIAHKSEVGGVKIGIADAAALKAAVTTLLSDVPKKVPGARIDGVVVQEMIKGLGEAIVGFRRDPRVGPLVAVGVGGILAEVYGDVAVRPAPVDLASARAMIAEVKGFAPLRGFRGLPEGDLDALAAIVVTISHLALSDVPQITEAEINPVIVRAKGEGAVAVDGLVVLAG